MITNHLARNRIPSIVPTLEIHSIVFELPTYDGHYGAKGVEELSNIQSTPAITNAIYNAAGVRVDKLPVDHEQFVHQINAEQ